MSDDEPQPAIAMTPIVAAAAIPAARKVLTRTSKSIVEPPRLEGIVHPARLPASFAGGVYPSFRPLWASHIQHPLVDWRGDMEGYVGARSRRHCALAG